MKLFNITIVTLIALTGCSLGNLGDELPTDAAAMGDAGPMPATDSGPLPVADAGPLPVVDSGTPTPDAGPPPAPDAGPPPWRDCGDSTIADAITVRVSSDSLAEASGNIGACAETWDPYLLQVDPFTGEGYAYGAPGSDIEYEPIYSEFGEAGWMRFGFKCGYGEWATSLPPGRTAESLGVTVLLHFGSETLNVSSEATVVVREDGPRLETRVHYACP